MSSPVRGTHYLNDPSLVSVYDELPLWSAPFGLMLLDMVKLRSGMTVLDFGSGTGFPLLELAQRLGDSCRLCGIDPWKTALDRVRLKMQVQEIRNVALLRGVAEQLPFPDATFDLVVANNGINNVSDAERVLSECARTSRKAAQMVLTMNLPDTMKEFYQLYEEVLTELGKPEAVPALTEHILTQRSPRERMAEQLRSCGFEVRTARESSFQIRFLSGTAMLNHYFIRLAFLEEWKKILPAEDVKECFTLLEQRLNEYAEKHHELNLTVPFVCFDCVRI
jgi:ubiquinone/menaquinone biosynthesis C-methylase UbiE